jgi:DNA-directed RNA polymerase beta subunit
MIRRTIHLQLSLHVYAIFRYVSDDLKDNDAIEHFGQQLEEAGYNYYGTETLYSGTDGIPMTADIFFGVIHYQRLRHMVSDKFQVRIETF